MRQAVNELADERGWPLAPDDRHALDECLDEAVAHAVTSFVAEHDRSVERGHTEKMGELAHELRNLLSGAILAFRALERGSVGVGGSTSAVLGRSLTGLRELVDRSLAGVRLDAGIAAQEQVAMRALIHEVEIAAMMHAHARRVRLVVAPVARDVLVEVDRTTLGAAVMNLLQNAIKFTRPRGEVVLRAHAVGERVLIDVKDECGGLPPGKADELFRPFEQRGADRSGLGLGLSISRRAVAASGGELRVRDRPGRGCVFTIELPRFRARDLAGPAPSATRMRARRASSGS